MAKKKSEEEEESRIVNHFPVVGIGASAGGLEPFKQFVKAIPQNTGMAFLFMQHLDPNYETNLSGILQRETSIPVVDLDDKAELKPDHIYIMPSNKLLIINDNTLTLEVRTHKAGSLDSIDIFFSALAEIFQSDATGVLLSGMGSDGTLGLKKIKDFGGVCFVQSLSSAGYKSMPQHALDAEVVDFEMEPEDIPQQLLKINSTLQIVPLTENYIPEQAAEENHFKQILTLLRNRRDVDFTYYKQTTIRRRILRRMLINKIDELPVYVKMLKQNIIEQDTLYQDLLIPVTSFFRDPLIFDNLCQKVLPLMFENKNLNTPVRIWVAACSTGEEAYSVAICLHEFLGERISGLKMQLFATDLSEKSIQKARLGIYSKKELEGVSVNRLKEYFIKIDGHYQLKKVIRDLCVFATHNFLKDPPFAKMDLITCRNVLIYLEGYLQKKALGTFHYALNEKGILLLGKSETAGNAPELFKVVGKNEKIYERKSLPGRSTRVLPERSEKLKHSIPVERPQPQNRREDYHKNADDILLSKYTPAGVVVNEQAEIVQFRGSTGLFLEAAPGKASFNILKMARPGLSFEIRNALHKAKETRDTVIKKDIPLFPGDQSVNIEVVPLLQTIEPHYLVLFSEGTLEREKAGLLPGSTEGNANDGLNLNRVRQLEKELGDLREDMRAITEDQEAANEELQSANEELLSGSEELQSLNEELETSKEELQSTNEELITMNQELYERNEQYNQARLYSEAIVGTIREPLLVLTRDLRIKSANRSFYEFFKMSEDQIIGKILFELQNSAWDIPELRTQLLKIQTGKLDQLEWEVDFELPVLGEKILYLNAKPVLANSSEQMILLAFEDISLRKKEEQRVKAAENALKEELKLMEHFFVQAPALFCILKGPDHRFEFVNPRYVELSGGDDLKGKCFTNAFPELGNEGYKKILDDVYRTGVSFLGREMKANNFLSKEGGKEIFIDISCQPYYNQDHGIEGILLFSYEVTDQVMARRQVEKNAGNLETIVTERTAMLQTSNRALELSNKNLQEFASITSHDLQEPLRKIKNFINLLGSRFGGSLPEDAKALLEKTETSANRMSDLIKDVLDYSRVSSDKYVFEKVDLSKTFKKVLDDLDVSVKEKRAHIKVEGNLPVIEAVPAQMQQLLHNLLGNALKFTRAGENANIILLSKQLDREEIASFKSLDINQTYCRLELKDDGIGFEQQFAEQIFSIFERLYGPDQYEGTGIGLALCAKIVNNHRGLIWAESAEEKGASFFIILPCVQ